MGMSKGDESIIYSYNGEEARKVELKAKFNVNLFYRDTFTM